MARVAFCQDVLIEFMGYMSMASVLKQAGHEVEVFFDDQMDEDAFIQELASFGPDLVGFSVLSPTAPWALKIAGRVKREIGALTILGNVHALFNHGLIDRPEVDILCIGEGEEPLRELADRLDRGLPYHDIPSLLVTTPQGAAINPMGPLVDVNALPFADRTLYDKFSFFRRSPYQRVLVGRGCPYSCRFCANPKMKQYFGKGYLRKMTPERAVAELEHHAQGRDPKYLIISDEVLWVSNRWLREFLPLYRQRLNARFIANYRWGPITEDDIALMAESGAEGFVLAVETGDERQRMVQFGKKVTDREVLWTADMLHKYGIKYTVSAFFGVPGDTVADHMARADFYQRLKATYVWTTFFQPFPGTAMAHDPDVIACLPRARDFEMTLHNQSYLEVADRRRISNLKKVYYWVTEYPAARRALLGLTRLKADRLFDFLFLIHFSRYIFAFEKVSLRQYLHHLKQFAALPLLRLLRPKKRGA